MKNLAEKQTAFIPNIQLCIGFVFSVGVIACVGLVLSALMAAAYLLNLTMTVIAELGCSIASTYAHVDPTVQCFMLAIAGFCILKFFRCVFLQKQ